VKPGHVEAAPDLVVEVTSEWTRMIDRLVKRNRYLEFDVPEYCLLEPFEPRIEVLRLEERKYRVAVVFRPGDTLESPTFLGFRLPLASL
jgi:Uma2 family endonuclease